MGRDMGHGIGPNHYKDGSCCGGSTCCPIPDSFCGVLAHVWTIDTNPTPQNPRVSPPFRQLVETQRIQWDRVTDTTWRTATIGQGVAGGPMIRLDESSCIISMLPPLGGEAGWAGGRASVSPPCNSACRVLRGVVSGNLGSWPATQIEHPSYPGLNAFFQPISSLGDLRFFGSITGESSCRTTMRCVRVEGGAPFPIVNNIPFVFGFAIGSNSQWAVEFNNNSGALVSELVSGGSEYESGNNLSPDSPSGVYTLSSITPATLGDTIQLELLDYISCDNLCSGD